MAPWRPSDWLELIAILILFGSLAVVLRFWFLR